MTAERTLSKRVPRAEKNLASVPFVPREGAARAPLIFILAGLSVSIAAVSREIPVLVASLLALLTVWGLLLILSEYRPPRFFFYVAFLSLLAFACALSCGYRLVSAVNIKAGVLQDEGTVVLERSWGSRRIVLVDASSGRYLMRLPPNRYVLEGDTLSFSGRAKEIASRPGSSFREDLYWEARGVSIEILPESITRKTGGWSLSRWRTALRKRILLTLPYRTRGYLLAAVLGLRDPDLTEAHRRWGTSHLLAVSGFHVGLVAFAVCGAFFPFRLSGSSARAAQRPFFRVSFSGGTFFSPERAPGALRAALMIQSLLLRQGSRTKEYSDEFRFPRCVASASLASRLVLRHRLASLRDGRASSCGSWRAPPLILDDSGFEPSHLVGRIPSGHGYIRKGSRRRNSA